MDIPSELRRELICVCPTFNPPATRTLTDELAGEMILRSVEVAAKQAFCWTLLDKPREGTIFLLFFGQQQQQQQQAQGDGSGGNAASSQTIIEDGLIYLQTVERVRTSIILKEGYELEVREKTGGYLPGETTTSRERRMFRLKNLPKSGGREQLAAIIEGLTLVHYAPVPEHLRGPAPFVAPRRPYPLPQLPPMLVYLFGPPPPQQQGAPAASGPPGQGTGPIMDRVNNLSGRGNKSASGSPLMAPNSIRQPHVGRPTKGSSKQFPMGHGHVSPGTHGSPGPNEGHLQRPSSASAPTPGAPSQGGPGSVLPASAPQPAMPMYPLPPPQDLLITGDEFDRITPRDIALARYKRRHDLMALLLSPYGLNDFDTPPEPDYAWAYPRQNGLRADDPRSAEEKMRERIAQLRTEIDGV